MMFGLCRRCKRYTECSARHPSAKMFRCPVCGRMDSCGPVRDGLCLRCYAAKWNKDHPINPSVAKTMLRWFDESRRVQGGYLKENHGGRE